MTRTLAAVPALLLLLPLTTVSEARAQYLEPPPPMAPAAPGTPGYPAQPPPPGTPSTPAMTPVSNGSPDDESEDSGLGLEWVYLNADLGASYVDMQSFSESHFGLVSTHAAGPAFGVAAGVRLLFFTLGLRARDLLLTGIGNLWMLNAEAAFHTRIWRIDPYFGVRGGYDFVGSLDSDSVQVATGGSPSDVSVHGWNVGPMVGIDLYLAKWLSVGADADAQFLFLQRPRPPLPAGVDVSTLPPAAQTLYNQSGSSVGFGTDLTAHLGVHF
jgi:hypothetical protein